MLLRKLEEKGLSISLADGDHMAVSSASKLTDEQRDYLKRNKPQIIRELKLFERATSKLKAAGGRQLDDLLDWYQDDMAEIAAADTETVNLWVRDYLDNRDAYRRLQAGELN